VFKKVRKDKLLIKENISIYDLNLFPFVKLTLRNNVNNIVIAGRSNQCDIKVLYGLTGEP